MTKERIKLRDRSCSIDENMMNAAIEGHRESRAIIEAWRFSLPVIRVDKIEGRAWEY